MNPHTLIIKTTIAMHKEIRDVSLVFKRYIALTPYEGLTIRFTNDDEEQIDITLMNLHYDYDKEAFVEEQEDRTLLDELRDERAECTVLKERLQEYINEYKSFGWEEVPRPSMR